MKPGLMLKLRRSAIAGMWHVTVLRNRRTRVIYAAPEPVQAIAYLFHLEGIQIGRG